MRRRDFLGVVGGGVVLPMAFGRLIAAEELVTTMDVAAKKRLADAALNIAKGAGASYCDVRVGRYLRQSVLTREKTVQNVVNAESLGVGVRVIVDGAWGFAATNDMTPDGVAAAARSAAAIARANARQQTEPVRLAPAPAQGEVT
ncbi:PmbA/TldA family metallopeptidase, partial [Polymorphobacter multimanifer]